MRVPPVGVAELGDRLRQLGWVSALLVGGSAATGDHVPGVSDLDLVAVATGRVDEARQTELTAIHRDLDPGVQHPTWTHGGLVQCALSGISRAELVRHGYAVFGAAPASLLPPVDDDDVRRAAHAELTGYWATAAARPWWWLATGRLLTKTAALEDVDAPAWLVTQLRDRRAGGHATSPRFRTAVIAWRDVRRTVATARRWSPPQR